MELDIHINDEIYVSVVVLSMRCSFIVSWRPFLNTSRAEPCQALALRHTKRNQIDLHTSIVRFALLLCSWLAKFQKGCSNSPTSVSLWQTDKRTEKKNSSQKFLTIEWALDVVFAESLYLELQNVNDDNEIISQRLDRMPHTFTYKQQWSESSTLFVFLPIN